MRKIFVVLFIFAAAVSSGCKGGDEHKGGYQTQPGPVRMPIDTKRLEDVARSHPDNSDGWIALGNALYDSNRWNEAIDAYQKALAIDPKNVDVRVDMGTCYRSIGKPESAVEEYRKAVKIKPDHLYGHKNLGVVLAFDLNDRANAIKEFETYLRLAPNAQDAEQVRGIIRDLNAAK